jgi:hypothetical protein
VKAVKLAQLLPPIKWIKLEKRLPDSLQYVNSCLMRLSKSSMDSEPLPIYGRAILSLPFGETLVGELLEL